MNSKRIIKTLFLLTVASLPLSAVMAQGDVSKIYGVYEGKATTTFEKNKNEETQGMPKDIKVEILAGQGRYTKMILKDYSVATYFLKDIPLPDNIFSHKDGVWNIKQENNVSGYFQTKDGEHTPQLTIFIEDKKSKILADGTLELHFAVLHQGIFIKHVFKGKKQVGTGIKEIAGEKQEAPVYYDLQGRRVTNPTHGIYIVNGRKVLI